MKRRITAIVLCLFLSLTLAGHAEEEPRWVEGYVIRGSQRIAFLYPEGCEIEIEDSIGTAVFLDDGNYVALAIPRGGVSGVDDLLARMLDSEAIVRLSEDMHVCGVHGDDNHRMPYLDIVSIGINLPDGGNVGLAAFCDYGTTEVYDLLLTIVSSMTDAALLEEWLTNEWIPYITAQ